MKLTKIIAITCCLLAATVHRADAQLIDIITGAVKKVVRAADLKIQRQQNKVIWLQNAQKALENEMSRLKLKEISDWSEKQRKLYDDYFRELQKVKAVIATYRKVKEIMAIQLALVSEYKRAWGLLSRDEHFNGRERDQMYRVYSGILEESMKNLDQLMLVTSSFSTQMSDGKRLELIDRAGRNLEGNLTDLRRFNNGNFQLSIGRSRDLKEAQVLKQLYGVK